MDHLDQRYPFAACDDVYRFFKTVITTARHVLLDKEPTGAKYPRRNDLIIVKRA